MRYFMTTIADRPVRAGGRQFIFEPVALRGGSWFGVLALDEESGASILSGANHPSVSEIDLAAYEAEKKKQESSQARWTGSPPIHRPPPGNAPSVADHAGRLIDRTSGIDQVRSGPGQSVAPSAGTGISAVTLLTTKKQPPIDPILIDAGVKGKFGQ